MKVAFGKQFSGVFKHKHKSLTSEIWALVYKRSPEVVVERGILKLNGTFESG